MTRFYHSSSLQSRFNSAGKLLSAALRLIIFVVAVSLISSCEEGPAKIGSNLFPSNDFVSINSTDTLSVWSYTMYNSRIPTNNPSSAMIGNVYNPYFGTTTAEFVSQVRLGAKWSYGPVVVDSVKLVLRFLTVKGGSTTTGSVLKLSEISDTLSTDAVYYSDTETHKAGVEVLAQLPVLRADTINTVAVSLPIEFGEYLIRDTTKLFYSTTKPDYRSFFKGLHFEILPSANPLMVSFSMISQASNGGSYYNYVVMFMHDTADVKQKHFFILDAVHKNACYNKFAHDFSSADPAKKIQHVNDMNFRDSLTYIQYLNGVYTKLVFPGLDSLKKKFAGEKFSINKARLTVPAFYDGESYISTTVTDSLRLRYENKDGDKFVVPDFYVESSHAFFDGSLHKTDSAYVFNLATYIQTYLEDKSGDYKPELEIYQRPSGIKSVILRANANKIPVKFELTYTKF